MNLQEFLESPLRNVHVLDCGLEYYVRKSILFPGVIELASVTHMGTEGVGLWKFLRRYSAAVPFYMEQVLNPRLAAYMRRLGWLERDVGSTPQFASPLMARLHGASPRFLQMFPDSAAEDPRHD